MKPYIFIFDIDGTLIGDITPQVMMYDIVQEIKKTTGKNTVKFDNNDLLEKLRSGIVRPHFTQFITMITEFYQDVEFYIYTASKKEWAEYIIKNIEKAYKIKFNRPIFTRNDCTNNGSEYKKNLTSIKTRIVKSLKKKYPTLTMNDLTNRTLMIDNNNVFHPNDQGNLVICPSYSYRYPENIPGQIKCQLFEKNHRSICSVINRYIINLPLTSNFLKFQKHFYQNYVDEISKTTSNNYKDDTFWLQLGELLIKKNIKTLDYKTVKYINLKVGTNKIMY
jgi:histidinol phosphatase-like enzyme